MISPLRMVVPDLYDRFFTEGYVPRGDEEDMSAMGLFTPQNDEDFEAMFEAWSDLGDLDLSGVFQEEIKSGPQA
jgi:hypothetical protein